MRVVQKAIFLHIFGSFLLRRCFNTVIGNFYGVIGSLYTVSVSSQYSKIVHNTCVPVFSPSVCENNITVKSANRNKLWKARLPIAHHCTHEGLSYKASDLSLWHAHRPRVVLPCVDYVICLLLYAFTIYSECNALQNKNGPIWSSLYII